MPPEHIYAWRSGGIHAWRSMPQQKQSIELDGKADAFEVCCSTTNLEQKNNTATTDCSFRCCCQEAPALQKATIT